MIAINKIKDPKIIKSNATFIFGGNNESCGVLLQHINLNDFAFYGLEICAYIQIR